MLLFETLTEKQKHRCERKKQWGLKMAFLRALHAELEPERAASVGYGWFYRLRNCEGIVHQISC